MPDNPEQDGVLSERLLARSVNVGVVDVGWAQRQYARSADFVADRFAVLGDLNARYGTVDSRAAGTTAPLPVARGEYVRAESEAPTRDDGDAPGGVGLESTPEVIAPTAREGGGSPTLQRKAEGGPTLQRKAIESESTPAPPEKHAPLVSNEGPSESASTPTLMRLASESASTPTLMRLASETTTATGRDVNAPELTSELTLESPRAASPEESGGDAPSVSDAPPIAREVVQAVSVKHDAGIQPTFAPEPERVRAEETAGAESSSATSMEEHSLPLARVLAREEDPRVSPEPTATVMRAARVVESAPQIQQIQLQQIQRASLAEEEEDEPAKHAVETTLAASASASGGEQSIARYATESTNVRAAETTRPRLSAPEILQSPSPPLVARMVLRKSQGGNAAAAHGPAEATRAEMPYVAPAQPSSPVVANTQTLYRAAASAPMLARLGPDEEGISTPAPITPSQSGAGALSLEQITEHVSRVLFRRIAIERERRGARRWL